jgi:hypothetical protein
MEMLSLKEQIAQLCRRSLMAMSLKMAGYLKTHIEALIKKPKRRSSRLVSQLMQITVQVVTACTRSLVE